MLNPVSQLIRRLKADQHGSTSMVDLILINSIVVIGMMAGLTTFRDQMVQFFGDTAVALESLDQSYSYTVGASMSIYSDPAPTVTDPDLAPPAGIAFVDATIE